MPPSSESLDWTPAGLAGAGPYRAAELRYKPVTERWERRQAMRLRRTVFCTEQGLFRHHDRDAQDREALLLVVLNCVFGMPEDVVGTVRIAQTAPGQWQGSRLAVQADYRAHRQIGTQLIRLAVGIAVARGAQRFTAQVQAQNVALFERLHWRALERIELQGRPHCLMQAELAHYPACGIGPLPLERAA
ncbi:MSMEG_0567/Sll0786 family nitrogen starvation N-acetyltransferase [Panacagrimonas sp.]|uniref:MSMEG_0567/Sll0786 family nitrogen starvation N-acetyltransferase n=1 Tax=Panacagrimonas sp. TaxID=2480088 RepID=UPI003B522156